MEGGNFSGDFLNQKQNVFDIENARVELAEKTCLTTSVNQKVYLYFNYFQKIFETENQNIIEAFLKEFLDDYQNCISIFDVSGNDPDFTKELITHLKNLSNYFRPSNDSLNIDNDIQRIETCYNKLVFILNGEDSACSSEPKAYFPLIDKSHSEKVFGAIDSVTIRINKSSDGNKFIIVPSEKEIENKILNQIHVSWNLAIELSEKYLSNVNKYHEVIVNFDKHLGFYEGNSRGTALTLSFLERLLKFYNPVYVINIGNHTAFTGGVDSNGKILSTGEEIIKQKVKTLFFSDIKCFVIPKCEENFAFDALTQLQKVYPKRKFKLIPVEDFSDVINRRDLVDIKRQKIIVRTGKFVKKNQISSVAIVLLSILFAFLFVVDWDNNPSYVTADGIRAYIRDEQGRFKKLEATFNNWQPQIETEEQAVFF